MLKKHLAAELQVICQAGTARYVIADQAGLVVDDAQGWGYKTAQKAHKAMWYKFGGGKQKVATERHQKQALFKQHPGLEDFIQDWYETGFKELARGEITEDDLLAAIAETFGLQLTKGFLGR